MTQYIPIALLAVTVVLVGCGGDEEGAGAGGFAMPPTAVEVATVEIRTILDRFEAIGTLQAGESVVIVSEIDGVVTRLPFREGSSVNRGALLAQLDDAQLQAETERANALLAQSQATYDRIKKVVDLGAGAPQDLDDASAALKVAKSNVALAETRLLKTRIVAPFSGLIGSRQVSAGTFLRAGQAITDLAQVSRLRVNFSVPERYLSQLSRGARVTVTTPAYPDQELTGAIEVVEPILDSDTRSARVVALIDNPGRLLRPGMSANVTAVLSTRDSSMALPSEAIFVDGTQPFVFVVASDSTVHRTPLSLGTRMSDVVEVLSGVQPGDVVVRAGHQKLYEGARIMPVNSSAPVEG